MPLIEMMVVAVVMCVILIVFLDNGAILLDVTNENVVVQCCC